LAKGLVVGKEVFLAEFEIDLKLMNAVKFSVD